MPTLKEGYSVIIDDGDDGKYIGDIFEYSIESDMKQYTVHITVKGDYEKFGHMYAHGEDHEAICGFETFAKQMKAIADKENDVDNTLSNVYKKIKEAAQEGEYSIKVPLNNKEVQRLEQLGFLVLEQNRVNSIYKVSWDIP